jgi:UDP-glucuronate 4-epimerase
MGKNKKAAIVVTGAAGFIGSHLCERLTRDGHQVVGIDNFDRFYSAAIKRRNLLWLREQPSFRMVRGDICKPATLDEALAEGARAVIHLAALAGVRPSMERPLDYQRVNVGGTMAVLDACRRHAVEHLVFGSSSSVYGNQSRVPFREDDPATNPISVYAATKRGGELLCHCYADAYGMNITMLRFFTVYGPRQRPDLAIHKFARLILAGKPIPFFGDGSMERDFTYVEDTVAGVVSALEAPAGLRVFNLGSDRPVRLDHLVESIEQAVGATAIREFKPAPVGDVSRTWADLTRSRQGLGYHPQVELDEGLERFVAWLRQQPGMRRVQKRSGRP